MAIIDVPCDIPSTAANYANTQQCQLVKSCQARKKDTAIPVPVEIQVACDKAFLEWNTYLKAKQDKAPVSDLDNQIKALLPKAK